MKSNLLALFYVVVTIGISWMVPEEHFYLIYALFLSFAGGVYVGFAVIDPSEYVIQWGFALGFTLIALFGLVISPLFLIIGWVGHALWDLLHHYGKLKTKVTPWYPHFCLIYDLLIATYLGYEYFYR